jgi:hypothetical protein
LIIKSGNLFLVGWNHFYHCFNWSTSYYDAWRTRDIEAAKRVVSKTGGKLFLFNPVVSQIKELA